MSMLGAFFRGAAGAGLVDYANRLDRRDAMAAEDERRKREREEERAWRSAEAEKDRLARAESAAIRSGGRRSGSGSGGGDGEGGGDDRYEVAAIMKKFNVSEGKARQLLEANRQDQNPFVNEVADESGGHSAPNMKRWGELNSAIAESLRSGASMARSNYAQLTEGDGNAQRNQIVNGMLDGRLTPAQTAEGVAASKGEGAFGQGNVNRFSGTPDSIGKSEIAENMAQASSAGRANRDKPDSNKPDLSWLKKEYEAVTQEIAKARAAGSFDPSRDPQQQALLDRALDIEGRLASAGAPVDNKAIAGAVAGILDAARKAKAGNTRPADVSAMKKPDSMKRTAAPELETTKSNTGRTMYRYKGQDRWYPTKEEALANLGKKDAVEAPMPGARGMLNIGPAF